MNHLNSVLIEGHVTNVNHDANPVPFAIRPKRWNASIKKLDDDIFDVLVSPAILPRLGTALKEKLVKKALVRVVGRLAIVNNVSVVIAEHIEFRPDPYQEAAI